MSDDLLKRARAQIVEGEEYVASIGGKVIQQGFMPLLCDRIEELTEQLAAARQDAKEAEAYAEELEQERDEAIRRRDAWKAKAEGYDAVRKALREKVGAPWPPNLSRALWAGIAADEKKRADDAEAKLEEFRHALLWCGGSADFNEGGVAREGWLKVCAPLLKGESHD